MNDVLALTGIAVYVVVFFLALLIARFVFSIPKFLRIKKAELKILSEMALKAGVEPDKISGIINEAKL
jgi:hypothetical protein